MIEVAEDQSLMVEATFGHPPALPFPGGAFSSPGFVTYLCSYTPCNSYSPEYLEAKTKLQMFIIQLPQLQGHQSTTHVFIDWDQMVNINEISICTCAHFHSCSWLWVWWLQRNKLDQTPRGKNINMAATKKDKLKENGGLSSDEIEWMDFF